MENDNVKCPKCGTAFNKMFLMGKQGNCDVCPMCGAELQDVDEHPDWITWWYYKDIEYGDLSLWDKPPLRLERYELIQEFKAPPESECGLDEVKRILRTYVPDAFEEPKKADAVFCPRCGCNEFTLLNRGYSILTGFLGSGKVKRVCNRCKKEF
ncbi:MAG: hypothetical protein HDR11_13800 [Lachnospiraceae bacterium]|nr:hypothetical protein [Lachnospiraceae bacterium]